MEMTQESVISHKSAGIASWALWRTKQTWLLLSVSQIYYANDNKQKIKTDAEELLMETTFI